MLILDGGIAFMRQFSQHNKPIKMRHTFCLSVGHQLEKNDITNRGRGKMTWTCYVLRVENS